MHIYKHIYIKTPISANKYSEFLVDTKPIKKFLQLIT